VVETAIQLPRHSERTASSSLNIDPPATMLDGAEVAKHSSRRSCWIVINDKVYDVTSFVPEHPGGSTILLKQAGAVMKLGSVYYTSLQTNIDPGRLNRIRQVPLPRSRQRSPSRQLPR